MWRKFRRRPPELVRRDPEWTWRPSDLSFVMLACPSCGHLQTARDGIPCELTLAQWIEFWNHPRRDQYARVVDRYLMAKGMWG
jgi:hypothetical protein